MTQTWASRPLLAASAGSCIVGDRGRLGGATGRDEEGLSASASDLLDEWMDSERARETE
jgi:hypothetical protein